MKKRDILTQLVDLQIQDKKLPELSHVEKVKFDNGLAIDQLYYSSKLEGSNLSRKALNEAIHGKNLSTA